MVRASRSTNETELVPTRPGRQPARAGEDAGHPPPRVRRRGLDVVFAHPRARGVELLGELGYYDDIYRLWYLRLGVIIIQLTELG